MAPRKHSVLLIHGIRTQAEWAERTAHLLESQDPSIHAVPIRYGFFDLLRFLCPARAIRDKPVTRITKLVRDELSRRPEQLSVIAHSFGSYIISQIFERENEIHLHRLILCGSIIPNDFPWEKYAPYRLDANADGSWHALNDCGMQDILPVLAASATWGYGASGRFGFGHPRIKDRFFTTGHSGFFSDEFVRKNWLPYLENGEISAGELQRPTTPWWVSLLTVVKLRYAFVAILIAMFAVVGIRAKELYGAKLGIGYVDFTREVDFTRLRCLADGDKNDDVVFTDVIKFLDTPIPTRYYRQFTFDFKSDASLTVRDLVARVEMVPTMTKGGKQEYGGVPVHVDHTTGEAHIEWRYHNVHSDATEGMGFTASAKNSSDTKARYEIRNLTVNYRLPPGIRLTERAFGGGADLEERCQRRPDGYTCTNLYAEGAFQETWHWNVWDKCP